MFPPFVLPECLIVALVVLPVRVHVRQEVSLAEGLKDLGDVGVGARGIAVGIEGSVAVVRPGSIPVILA